MSPIIDADLRSGLSRDTGLRIDRSVAMRSGQARIGLLGSLAASAVTFGTAAWLTSAYVPSYVPAYVGEHFSLISGSAAAALTLVFAAGINYASRISELVGLNSNLSRQLTEREGTINGLRTEITRGQTEISRLDGLRQVYLDGILSMREGDRRTFINVVTTNVLMEETAAGLAQLLSPFPEATAAMLFRGRSSDIAAKMQSAVQAMEMPVQIKLTSSLFRLAVGDETALSDILGPRRYVPMLDTSAATIAEAGLSGALLSAAAGSKSNGIRTAAANCADISDTAVLQRLVSDPSPDVRKAAAAKLLSGGSTPQMLGTLYSSAHPEIRTSVIESPHVTDDILLKALNDPDQNVALAAANKALGSSPSPAAVTTAATSRWPGVVAKAVALVALTDKASVKNLLASTDALVRSAMIGRAKSSLTAADLTDIAGSNTNPDVLWMVIEHSASTPAAAAKALNGAMKKTNKVIDVEEKTHWQSGSTDSEPGEDVVDQEEVSHYEYQPADITKAVKSLTKKTSTAPAILHAVTGDLASVLTSAYNNIVGEQIIASVRTGKTTPANIAPAAQYLSGLDAARAADIISGLDAGVAASLLSAMQVEKSAAIHAKLPDAFKLAMLRKASGR